MRADLALVGFGNVGRRFARLLEERRDWLSLDYDLDCRIVGIATRHHGSVYRDSGIDAVGSAVSVEGGHPLNENGAPLADGTMDVIRRLAQSDAPLKVLVETTTLDINAGQPAIDHVRAALQSGCHAVTANKGPTAFAYEELNALAHDRDVSFLFEGADGRRPIFNMVREATCGRDQGFRGVEQHDEPHPERARGGRFRRRAADAGNGIAEADPSLDVDGWDAAAKTSALANVLMRARMTPQAVEREGIGPATARLAMAAKARGARVRLVASARRTPQGVVTQVRPEELPEADLLAGLRGMANALVLQTDLLGEIAICQLGGSLTQTAYALVSDLVTIRRRQRSAPHGAGPGRSL